MMDPNAVGTPAVHSIRVWVVAPDDRRDVLEIFQHSEGQQFQVDIVIIDMNKPHGKLAGLPDENTCFIVCRNAPVVEQLDDFTPDLLKVVPGGIGGIELPTYVFTGSLLQFLLSLEGKEVYPIRTDIEFGLDIHRLKLGETCKIIE
ncbi:hypothetical protein HGA91_04200 [candidate division WWE3 bacterium]|nr:hypothetical protein [candidate division WWE3 bacterium]